MVLRWIIGATSQARVCHQVRKCCPYIADIRLAITIEGMYSVVFLLKKTELFSVSTFLALKCMCFLHMDARAHTNTHTNTHK